MSSRIRTYSELRRLESFTERYRYLALRGVVGDTTFGFDRWMNQQFYRSTQWKQIRNHIIVRDNGADLGIEGREIYGSIYIHHLNPMTVRDLTSGDPSVLDPEFLIATTHITHNAIHYGDERMLAKPLIQRRPGDTTLW